MNQRHFTYYNKIKQVGNQLKKHDFWFVLTLVLLVSSCGIDRNIKKGEKFLEIGEYFDAAAQFKTAYQKTPAKEREQRGK